MTIFHSKVKSRNRGMDSTCIKEPRDNFKRLDELDDKAKEFEADKERIDKLIEDIDSSGAKDKADTIRLLKQERQSVIDDYSGLDEEMQEVIEEIKGEMEEWKDESNELDCNLRSPTATGAVVNGHSAVRQRPA